MTRPALSTVIPSHVPKEALLSQFVRRFQDAPLVA